MTICAEQMACFETFGYLILKKIFNPDEMAEIIRTFDAMLTPEFDE
mgnify:FL=1|jgi:hypothetical protein